MPQKDRYQDIVIRALGKAGWVVTVQQVMLGVAKRRVYVDLLAKNRVLNANILVEVKSFLNIASPVDYTSNLLGQINMYQSALRYLENQTPIYVAVPAFATSGLLTEPLGRAITRDYALKWLVYDIETETITAWTL